MNRRTPGFTIVEVLVVVSIIALLIAILLPAIGKARDAARQTQSSGNLRNLAMANMAYASDWSDRQFTGCPDDIGIVGGDPNVYNDTVGCMGQLLAGYDQNGELFGAWCGGNLCEGVAGDPLTWSLTFHLLYQPLSYNVPPSAIVFGGFRTPNNKAFNSYVGSRFYDPIFWAPKDVITQRLAEPFFEYPEEFRVPENEAEVGRIVWSSYVWSPSAMFHPDVHSHCGFRNPRSFPAAYKSPGLGQCRFPDMKTWMLEHHWLQNNESEANPSFDGEDPSWMFNQGYNSVPITLFFDGHVAPVGVREAMDADGRARNLHESNNLCGNCTTNTGCETGLWHRGTQLGIDGYYGQYSYDTLVNSSYHILTTDGIQGRDVLSAQ
ncbi:MAG: prepilin-type N-terminal cleavage/methylation domain-containing protein [Planctomycetota bacterium]|nr:prepilin-type N-terminal cleavage/methylation domain-containing protein [Planctomycetota bacterium]MEE2895249.1 prepilin-type N-terminal cleavage/methylation domain-containing protein [Planctomycetota bacterium]